MMRRALSSAPRDHVCQICQFLCSGPAQPAARRLSTLSGSNLRSKGLRQLPSQSIYVRRFAMTISRPGPRQEEPAAKNPSIERHTQSQRQQFTDAASLAALIDRVTKAFLAQQGIPSEKTTYDALRACGQVDVEALPEFEQLSEPRRDAEGQSETIHLLDLDGGNKKKTRARAPIPAPAARLQIAKQELVEKISSAARIIINYPAVVLTPRLLSEYVKLQARLGKPETLPEAFSLYRLKPLARNVGGEIRFDKADPDRIQSAVPAAVAENALDAAIEAKDMDAAVAIITNTYAAKPFLRAKLLNKALIPGLALSVVPIGAYGLASSMSLLQDSMEQGTATGIAFAAILAYVAFTGTIGVVVLTTANDQMRRVTWLPGTPLRQRWLREEERAALDKVACAFGFKEQHRYGEEDGPEFQALRKYILGRGMVLDAVELMEGMN